MNSNKVIIYSNDMIYKASYGILDRYIDVTKILQNSLQNNNDTITINSIIFNYNPYFGKIKELNIILKSNKKIKVIDNTILEYNIVYEEIIEIIKPSDITMKIDNSITVIKKHIHTNLIENITKSTNTYDYIISTNVRDENNILEWIVYHLLIGFNRVVIIDHKSIIPIKMLIEPYEWKNKVEVIRTEMDGAVKMIFLNTIIIPYMKKNCKKYFIHLDGDEYIYIKNNKSIIELLNQYDNCNILTLNWLMFGSNMIEKNEHINKCILPIYTKSDKCVHNHFKSLIKINKINNFNYIQPHHILYKNVPTIYTNVMKHTEQYNGDTISHFNQLYPHADKDDLPCYIAHYYIQSKEEYLHRKINRNRDDIMAKRENDMSLLTHHNEIENNDLLYYDDTIQHILNNKKNSFGFIMIRYVNSIVTNESWIECYNSIRKFYKNDIIIIDDNSDINFLTDIQTVNCRVIQSEYPRRGEFLPYYYYIKNKFFNRAVVIHDSMIFRKYYDFSNIKNYNNFSRLFYFPNNDYNNDITYFKDMSKFLKNGNMLYQYHIKNIKNLIGCFGICYVIDYNYIVDIEKRYNISNLINYVDTRSKRQTLERFLSCLFDMDRTISKFKTCTDLLGSIHNNFSNKNVIIEKKFFGR